MFCLNFTFVQRDVIPEKIKKTGSNQRREIGNRAHKHIPVAVAFAARARSVVFERARPRNVRASVQDSSVCLQPLWFLEGHRKSGAPSWYVWKYLMLFFHFLRFVLVQVELATKGHVLHGIRVVEAIKDVNRS